MKKFSLALIVCFLLSMVTANVFAIDTGVCYGDVPQAIDAITVDAKKDVAYDSGLKIDLTRKHIAEEPDTDVKGTATLVWVPGYIYVYGEVSDGFFAEYSEDLRSNTPWTLDSMEVFLDKDNDGVDPMQYRIDTENGASFQFTDSNSYGAEASVADAIFEHAAVKGEGGYTVEFKIPFDGTVGEKIGLQLQINDMNTEGSRTCIYPTSSLNAGSWDSTLYDYVVLAAAPVVETAAPETAAPVTPEVEVAPETVAPVAPQTNDAFALVAGLFAVSALTTIVLLKKRAANLNK